MPVIRTGVRLRSPSHNAASRLVTMGLRPKISAMIPEGMNCAPQYTHIMAP
jgi:hypothetical protein